MTKQEKYEQKKAEKSGLHMRVYFVLLVFLILGVAVVAVILAQYIVQKYWGDPLPTGVWLLLAGLVISGGISVAVGVEFLKPFTRISRAMKRIKEGEFDTRLDEKSNIQEFREIYQNFNMMAKGLQSIAVLQNDFVSNVSHEFKTPLNAIEGYVTLLEDRSLSPEEQDEYVEKILLNTRRLSELVGNILLLSKVENQAVQEKKNRFRLDEQVRQSIFSLESKWTEKEIEFDIDMDEVTYEGYESMMMHVWVNLIDNAIKFSPKGGQISITLQENSDEFCFVIRDYGQGMTEEELKHIYDKFYQGDTSHRAEGNGLGLSLVRRILRISGGRISVESLPEQGSSFSVFLPIK
ncbi:MAG: HAMP domain-containing histidine kinase [Lachnospiraceae bacterium]|nr:HAMP domain-containing histidine kinase [Lachnospiraceae bacterium]